MASSPIAGRIGQPAPSHLISPHATAAPSSITSSQLHSSASSSSSQSSHLGTLDEPVLTTILRDLRRVGVKIRHVITPTNSQELGKELRDWDLWGPLLLCLLLATTLSISSPSDQSALIFSAVFVLVWLGGGVCTLNATLLSGDLSFLQSVCVLGYSLAPMCVASILCFVWSNKFYHFVLVILSTLWSIRAATGFIAHSVREDKKAIAVYPVVLFYTTIAWMILVQ